MIVIVSLDVPCLPVCARTTRYKRELLRTKGLAPIWPSRPDDDREFWGT